MTMGVLPGRSADGLVVELYGTRVAHVRPGTSPGRLAWEWTADAFARWGRGARVVGHLLPLDDGPSDLVAGVFADGLLPEGAGRLHYAVNAGIDPEDTFGLLARYGRDTAGALEFIPDTPRDPLPAGEGMRLGDSQVRELLEEAASSGRSGGLTSISLAGLVPKVALDRAPDGTWLRTALGGPSTWILKVAHPAESAAADVVDTEAACLDLGRRVGVTTIDGRVVEVDGLRAIAVSRYDRFRRDGAVHRIHQEDFAQMLGLNTSDPLRKFQRGRGFPSWREAARRLRIDGAPLSPLARLVVFSFLVGNTDHHAKNTSVLRHPDGRVSLAPAYDIAVHLHHRGAHRTAFDLAGSSDLATLTIGDVVEEVTSWDIPRPAALAAAQDVTDGLRDALAAVDRASHPGVTPHVWRLLEDRVSEAAGRLKGRRPPSAHADPGPPAEAAPSTDTGHGLPAFEEFFRDLTGHEPYVWQRDAATALRAGRIPDEISVPTGMGKTSLVVAWLWALAADLLRLEQEPTAVRRVPLRYVVVVDRRVIVDDTVGMARRIVDILDRGDETGATATVGRVLARLRDDDEGPTVEVRELRGGMPSRPENVRHPARPAIVVGTVDLVGSRLLFRGYGVSPNRRPLDAALLGLDTLLVLDEAHLAEQFRTTLAALDVHETPTESRLGAAVPARHTLVMTATPTGGAAAFDWEREFAADPTLRERRAVRGSTPVTVVPGTARTGDASLSAEMTRLDLPRGTSTIVFANTAAQARACALALSRRPEVKRGDAQVTLLLGGMPDRFRAAMISRLEGIRTGSPVRPGPDAPSIVVVATSTLEVGADLDADRLVTPVASAASLVQRLGRVNRVGARTGCDIRVVVGGGVGTPTPPIDEPVHGAPARILGAALLEAAPSRLVGLEGMLSSPAAQAWRSPAAQTCVLPAHAFAAYQRTGGGRNEPEVGRWLRRPDDPRAEVMVAFRRSLVQLRDPGALAVHLDRHPPGTDEVWTMPIALVEELARRSERYALLDPAGVEPALVSTRGDASEARVTPARILVAPPTRDAFGVPGGGDDLVDGVPGSPFALRRADEVTDEELSEAGPLWQRLLDPTGADTGWIELSAARAEREPVTPGPYPLDRHLADVERRTRIWAERLRLPETLVADIALAARLHDEGKRAPLAQAELSLGLGADGRLIRVVDPGGEALAKSTLPRRLWHRARRLVGVPGQYRHEAESAARFDAMLEAGQVQADDPLLVRHLVLTHHGFFRGPAPVVVAESGSVPAYEDPDDPRWTTRPDEFADLLERYGPYSLALAEALVRLADWHESRRLTS